MQTSGALRLKIANRIRRRRSKRLIPFFACVCLVTLYFAPRASFPYDREQTRPSGSSDLTLPPSLGRQSNRPVPVQYKEVRFNGFGSQFLRMLDAAAVAEASSSPLEIVERHYWNYGCAPGRGWTCYFAREPAPLRRNCTDFASWPPRWPPRADEPGAGCVQVASPAAMRRAAGYLAGVSGGSVAASRRLARGLWALNARTGAGVAQLLRRAGVHALRGAYVGLHIRRGDKRKEVPYVPLAQYARAVECVGGRLPVFVATDDGTVLAELRARLPGRAVLTLQGTPQRTGHYQINVNRGFLKANDALVVPLLAEATALRDAQWFIGTFSSNFARMVHVLRELPPDTSISLDDQWAPGVAWRTFGKPYCAYRDANKEYCRCRERNQT